MNTGTGLKIALLQIAPAGTLEGNLQKGLEACRRAKELGADITLFPEMWSNGYRIYDRPAEKWQAEAIPADGDFVNAFGVLARELDMAIGITLLERFRGGPRNTMVLFDRFGERKMVYAKVHTCDFDVERNLTPGDDFYVTELDTTLGMVKVGAMICYDREFPESARLLMLRGAELILTPNACPMEINRLSQLRGRAYENMLAIATCNYPGTVPDCNGGSSVFDGMAYLPGLEGSRDTCILQAGAEEGIYVAELDLEALHRYRESEVHGNAYRRPKLYGLLTGERVEEPFVRPNRRESENPFGNPGEVPEVEFAELDEVEDHLLKYAVIVARSGGKWVLCKHRERDTLEFPGGHREPGETILEAARRELYEETGALDYDLTAVCAYKVWDYGILCFAEIRGFEGELHREIERVVLSDTLPERWTYPAIHPKLAAEVKRRGFPCG